METLTRPDVLGRRLDRLRELQRPVAAPRVDRTNGFALDLAGALGGRIFQNDGGSLVIVETTQTVTLERARLDRLPYPVGAGSPLAFVDLETTGLATGAGTLAFLVGLGLWSDGVLRVHQLLLPDHAGERALLDLLCSLLPADAWLVSYNGKSFDWPLLTARYRLHRRDPPSHSGHLDLLHVARQLWRHRLGGARLALVEHEVCGVRRDADLPGHLIPERYFTYLRTRQPSLLADVVEHNRQDIVSLMRLLAVLANDFADDAGRESSHPGDLFGLARAYARRRRPAEALEVVDVALRPAVWTRGIEGGAQLHRRLSAERARLLAALGRRDEAYSAWCEIAGRAGPGAGLAWIHVARYREHVLRDIPAALDACREAGAIADRARAWSSPLVAVERDLSRRLPRLRRLAFRRRPLSRGVGRAA